MKVERGRSCPCRPRLGHAARAGGRVPRCARCTACREDIHGRLAVCSGAAHAPASAIGAFGGGGLVVDAGRGAQTKLPPIVGRFAFPEALARDPAARSAAARRVMAPTRLDGVRAACADFPLGRCRASVPAGADAGAAGRWPRAISAPSVRRSAELQARHRRLFRAAQGGAASRSRDVARPRGISRRRRRRRYRPELVGADRLCIRARRQQRGESAVSRRARGIRRREGLDIRVCAGAQSRAPRSRATETPESAT